MLRRKLAALRDRLAAELGPLDVPPVERLRATRSARSPTRVRDRRRRAHLAGAAAPAARCVFEGAQGVLLDEWHGFHPYTTWSTTTFANADGAARRGGPAGTARLGVLRAFTTRHGPGPLVTEDADAARWPTPHNPTSPWQGAFRVGHFDAVAHRYALAVAGGVDGLALTHLDAPVSQMCVSYDIGELPVGAAGDLDGQARLTDRLRTARPRYAGGVVDWPAAVTEALGVPVFLGSSGPTAADKAVFSSVITRERV